MSPQALSRLAGSHPVACGAGPLLAGSRLPCGQLVGRVASRQKQRLRDIPVKVQ